MFDAPMRIEHRGNAAEQALTVAHNLLHPDAPRPYAPVPYFWTDQYDLKLQCYGNLHGHDTCSVVEGRLAQRRFVVAYRTADRLSAVLAVGMPPKTLQTWRAAVAARTDTRGRQLLRTRTDGLGRYAVAGLPEDVVTVVLSAPHRTPAVTQVLPATGHEVRRDFVLAARH